MKDLKIVVYATNEKGEGHVMKVGKYETIEDIEIRVGMFADDVVITFGYDTEIQ